MYYQSVYPIYFSIYSPQKSRSYSIYLLVLLDNHQSIHPSNHSSISHHLSMSPRSPPLHFLSIRPSMHPFIHASISSFAHSFVQAFMHSLVTCIHLFLIPCFLLTLYWSDCQSKLHQAHISKTNQIKQWQSWGIDQSNLKSQLAWEWVCSGEKKQSVWSYYSLHTTCQLQRLDLLFLPGASGNFGDYRVFIFPYGNTLILSLVQHTADMKGQLLSNKVTWKWKKYSMKKTCFNTVGRNIKGVDIHCYVRLPEFGSS